MSNEITLIKPNETILCPRGSGQGDPIVIDMRAIIKTQNRIIEVQAVTPQKAPELLTSFNITWRDLHQHITFLAKEELDAERTLNRVRAGILLDEVPGILKVKGLKDTESNRSAIIDLDDRFEAAAARVAQIHSIVEGLKGMLKATEMAYNSVKKLLGESAYNYLNNTDPHYGEDVEQKPVGSQAGGSFGRPNY